MDSWTIIFCRWFAVSLTGLGLLVACGVSDSSFLNQTDDDATSDRFLYIASGVCYGGGVATSTGTGTISRYNLSTGDFEGVVIDYTSLSPGDLPAGIARYDADQLIVLVENANGRRVDLVNVREGYSVPYYLNATTLSAQLRGITQLSDGGTLIAKGTAIEKLSAVKSRITNGGNAYINAPAAPCATSNTVMTSHVELTNGKIIFAHAAATPNNLLGITPAAGYSIAADCLQKQAAPTTTALPTAMLYHSASPRRLLVAYGSATPTSNFIYSYDIDETANTFTNPTAALNNTSVINGASAIVENTADRSVYVANAINSAETIEKFSFNPTTRSLTRVGSHAFITKSIYTKCISGMAVSEW